MPRLFYESIVGNVTNNSGAVVPGATVTVMQTHTNESRSAVTNNSDYVVSTVTTGTYTVAISKPGFQVLETKDVNVTISTTVRVDGKLPRRSNLPKTRLFRRSFVLLSSGLMLIGKPKSRKGSVPLWTTGKKRERHLAPLPSIRSVLELRR